MFNTNDKVYFGRGPMEFVGHVLSAEAGKVVVSGVETGCLMEYKSVIEIEHLDSLRLLSDAEFEERTLNEPAFAGTMTKERFLQLQSELESLELCIAKGEETDATDFRIQEVELLMKQSPWMMHPDEGCIAKSDADKEMEKGGEIPSGRYRVGQTIPVAVFRAKNKNTGRDRYATQVFPNLENIIEWDVVNLVVTEQHAVPSHFYPDGEKSHTGYVLTDPDGDVWYNQYPAASYGQLDDSSDRLFYRKDWGTKNRALCYTALIPFMENLLRSAHFTRQEDDVLAKEYTNLYDKLKLQLESDGDYVVIQQPSSVKLGGFHIHCLGWYSVTMDTPEAIGKKLYADFVQTLNKESPPSIDQINSGLEEYVKSHTLNEQVLSYALVSVWNEPFGTYCP